MKKQKYNSHKAADRKDSDINVKVSGVTGCSALRSLLRNEKGIALAIVMVLSAIGLAIMAGLIYMITSGTQVSGIQKRYMSALETGIGGAEVTYQLIAARGNSLDSSLTSTLSLSTTTPSTCVTLSSDTSCTSIGSYTGLATKLNLPTSCWSSCDSSLTINPNTSTTYDMTFQLGTSPTYNVYAKIVDTVNGNSATDEGLLKSGVVSTNSGEVTVQSIPYLYTIEMDTENTSNPNERAKLSVLYQY